MNCFACKDAEMVFKKKTDKMVIKGEEVAATYEVEVCPKCGVEALGPGTLNKAMCAATDAYKKQMGLLTSDELKFARTSLGLTQESFAKKAGVGIASIKKWETGAIQNVRSDQHLRHIINLCKIGEIKIEDSIALIDYPESIANYFIKHVERLTNAKLLKLIYYAYGICLVRLGTPLFKEKIEAWNLGPVVPSIYHTFKRFKKSLIDEEAYIINDDFNYIKAPLPKNKEVVKILNEVIEQYGHLPASKLIDLTHVKEGPWYKVFKKNEKFIKIPDYLIYEFFTRVSGFHQGEDSFDSKAS